MIGQFARLTIVGGICLAIGLGVGYQKGTQAKQQYINTLVTNNKDLKTALDDSTAAQESAASTPTPETTTVIQDVLGCGAHGCDDRGCPKNQFVNGYIRKKCTTVSSYWRNDPYDNC